MRRSLVNVCLAVLCVLPAARADTTFEFNSGFWINLHHFLYEQALVDTPSASAAPAWQKGVDYYRREIVKRDLLTGEAALIDNRLSHLDDAASIRDLGLPSDLIAALD